MGPEGPRGAPGPKGDEGPEGEEGEAGPPPEHEWRGTRIRFRHPDGSWGKWVELKGQTTVVSGGGAISIGPALDEPLPEGIIVKQEGRLRVATFEQLAMWLGVTPGPSSDALELDFSQPDASQYLLVSIGGM